MISKLTNSKVGSAHWFNTLVEEQKRIGEFLSIKQPSPTIIKLWGVRLARNASELLYWHSNGTMGNLSPDNT